MWITKHLKKYKKLVLFVVLAVVLVAGGAPKETYAFWDIGLIAAKGIGWAAAAVGYIFGFIASALFYVGGKLIDIVLELNQQLFAKGSIVLVGWPIVLNFANLGFVLAIIIIAFATILRLENYAIKQTLWKLIVAALLVNFSLVIAGAFINISDNITSYFIKAVMPENATTFSETLAGVFKAQQFLQAENIDNAKSVLEGMSEFGATLLGFIAQLAFVAFFTILSALTLLAIAIMLLIRYVALGMLLILSPLAWLCWILPSTQGMWKKWWDNFLRWTFFAPAVSFFLYLTVITLKKYSEKPEGQLPSFLTSSSTSTIAAAENAAFNSSKILGSFIVGDLFLAIGLLMGGLYVANSLSITGASTAMNLAKGAGKGVGAWAGRKGLQLGRAGYSGVAQKAGLMKASENLAQKAAASKGLMRFAYSWAGRGVAKLSAGAEREPKQYEQKYKGMTTRQIMTALPGLFGAEKATALKEYVGRPDNPLKGKEKKQFEAKVGINKETKKMFTERYGMDFSDAEKKIGMSAGMGTALNNKDTNGFVGELRNFTKTLKKKDGSIAKEFKHFFDKPFKINDADEKTVADHFADAFAQENPAFASAALPHIGGFDMVEKFQREMNNAFDRWDNPKAKERKSNFNTAILNHMTSAWGAEEEKKGEEGVKPKSGEGKKS